MSAANPEPDNLKRTRIAELWHPSISLAFLFTLLLLSALNCRPAAHAQNSNQISESNSPITGMGSTFSANAGSNGESPMVGSVPPSNGGSGSCPHSNSVSGARSVSFGDSNAGGHNVLNEALRYAQLAQPPDYFSFCLALVSCAVAFLILTYSIQLQAMVTKGLEGAPDARFGIGWSWLLALVVMAVYFLYWLSRHQGETFCEAGFDLTPAVQSPQDFAPAFFLAAIAPGILALFKFTFIIPFMQSRQSETPGATRFPFSALLGILLTLTTLAANIAKLLESFHQHK